MIPIELDNLTKDKNELVEKVRILQREKDILKVKLLKMEEVNMMLKRTVIKKINAMDWTKVLKNIKWFGALALIVIITSLLAGKSLQDTLVVLYYWGLATALDLLRKFVAANPNS